MRIAKAAMRGAVCAGVIMCSHIADAINPKAKPAIPATMAPIGVAKKNNQVQRDNGLGHGNDPRDDEGGASVVALVRRIARPTVERVKLRHCGGKLRQVIAIHTRISEARSK